MDIFSLHKKFIDLCHQKVCTDSRKIIPGSMFFALKGENFDGNTFAQKALDLGCSCVVVDDRSLTQQADFIFVDDVQNTLVALAQYHRQQFNIPVVGLTGSNGKTTTKELMAAALSEQKEVVATEGNLNNHIGVPLTLLRINKNTDIAVVEMGANRIGEIKELCEIAQPTDGVITNIGRAHLGYFGGIGGVIEAKTELYRYIQETNGHLFVNASDELLMKYSSGIERTLYGSDTDGLFMVRSRNTIPFVSVDWDHSGSIQTKLTGEYNVDNIACAIAIAIHFDVINERIREGIESYVPTNSRSEMITTDKSNVVIKDFYNANASSMFAALDNAKKVSAGKPLVLILGDMFELGEYSQAEHQEVATAAQDVMPELLYLIGNEFSNTETSQAKKFTNTASAIEALKSENLRGSTILIKGSNGMNFKKLFDQIHW